ncbi:hypothetical protein VTJ04DRAFT_991 [Mycothermus thermophilus]|uniref:uncharacterized protein n=1 Tax=Humicola insolens TaxID=85995 RepID=UPI0037424498
MPEEACTPQEAPTTNFSNPRGEDDRMPGTPFQTSSASTEAQQKPLHETQADEQLPQDKDSKLGPMGLVISLIKELVEKAHDFFYDFLPKDDTPSHILCERYWGAVDTIIRQLLWLAQHSTPVWSVRKNAVFPDLGLDGVTTSKKQIPECPVCSQGHEYSSASEALKHLHDVHLTCPLDKDTDTNASSTGCPADDPCFAFLETPVTSGDPQTEFQSTADLDARVFLDSLKGFLVRFRLLQQQVAKPSKRPIVSQDKDASQQPTTPGTAAVSSNAAATPSRPKLPRSLVYAFEDLVASLVVTARIMGRAEFDVFDIPAVGSEDEAEDDENDDDTDKTLWIRGCDAMSFARVLSMSILRTSISAPLTQRVATVSDKNGTDPSKDDNIVINSETLDDIVAMYTEYCQELRSEATRRPRKSLFLDITALLDELHFLWVMVRTGLKRVDKHLKEIDTVIKGYSRVRSPFGVPMLAPVERECMLRELDALREAFEELDNLFEFAKSLKNRVAQMIEVLNEANDKSIRTFTAVTVIFLPMTFISGFFGMNTIDIRDIDADQTLYWTIAIPVTFLTLFATFVYGYKGDEIGDWLHRKFHSKIMRRFPATREAQRIGDIEAKILLSSPSSTKDSSATSTSEQHGRSVRDLVRQRLGREKIESVPRDMV